MEFVVPPWRHQREAIDRALPLPYYALFFEMGAGKTSTAINILRGRYNLAKRVHRTLVFCPPIVVKNWRAEWFKYSRIDPSLVIPLVGSGQKRLATFMGGAWEDWPGTDGVASARIFITNYESLLMPELYQAFMHWAPEALVFDESHKLKNHSAKRSKLAEKLANPGDREKPLCYLLSGSPVLNSPMDLFQQFLIMDGGTTLGKNFFFFRARFFRDRNAGMPKQKHFPDWRLIPGMEDEISRLISTVGMRVMKKDCLDLPPLVQQTIKVPLAPEQARLYTEMKRDFVTYLKNELGEAKAVSANLAITKALRLQQIASGYAKTVDGEEVSLDETPKMAALKELLEEITPNAKVLVWAVWKENYAQIRAVCTDLGIGFVEVHGGVSAADKDKAVERFNTDPMVRVFIGHPGSGGIGINLVVASYSIFYSRTFSLEHSLQAEARNHRGGSKEQGHEKITRIDLVCENTIDELVQIKLADKIEIGEKLLKDLSYELDKQVETRNGE